MAASYGAAAAPAANTSYGFRCALSLRGASNRAFIAASSFITCLRRHGGHHHLHVRKTLPGGSFAGLSGFSPASPAPRMRGTRRCAHSASCAQSAALCACSPAWRIFATWRFLSALPQCTFLSRDAFLGDAWCSGGASLLSSDINKQTVLARGHRGGATAAYHWALSAFLLRGAAGSHSSDGTLVSIGRGGLYSRPATRWPHPGKRPPLPNTRRAWRLHACLSPCAAPAATSAYLNAR